MTRRILLQAIYAIPFVGRMLAKKREPKATTGSAVKPDPMDVVAPDILWVRSKNPMLVLDHLSLTASRPAIVRFTLYPSGRVLEFGSSGKGLLYVTSPKDDLCAVSAQVVETIYGVDEVRTGVPKPKLDLVGQPVWRLSREEHQRQLANGRGDYKFDDPEMVARFDEYWGDAMGKGESIGLDYVSLPRDKHAWFV